MPNTLEFLQSECPFSEFPKISCTLGSGLGSFAQSYLERVRVIPYSEIPDFAQSTVEGHAGNLIFGKIGETEIVCLQGRFHFYEGYEMNTVVYPIQCLAKLGVQGVFLSNAAGGINRDFVPGTLMAIRDHINFMGTNPLIGPNDESLGHRFFDMTTAWDPELRQLLHESAQQTGAKLAEGVYLAVTGPSFETPAEITAFGRLGADAVGMSTVPECIAARHAGMRVAGISCITNAAAGFNEEPLTHEEVAETAKTVEKSFADLLSNFIPKFNQAVSE